MCPLPATLLCINCAVPPRLRIHGHAHRPSSHPRTPPHTFMHTASEVHSELLEKQALARHSRLHLAHHHAREAGGCKDASGSSGVEEAMDWMPPRSVDVDLGLPIDQAIALLRAHTCHPARRGQLTWGGV
mmetsp:Transcript_27001/g.68659  ORF Transcript_27001/g.68659 Transcript_27001/m.68659 type:complete len:130 (-) Transcript_27001:600-989(-)